MKESLREVVRGGALGGLSSRQDRCFRSADGSARDVQSEVVRRVAIEVRGGALGAPIV